MAKKQRSKDVPDSSAKTLRQRAEQQLRTSSTDIAGMPTEDVQSLVHELQVHQIELEIQNEELRQAQIELAESRDRFSDLYEYAPTGYLTLDRHGKILQANLSAARLLDVDRQQLVGAKFPDFVDRDGQDEWHFHRQAVFAGSTKQTCELPLRTAQGELLWARLESEAAPAETDGGQCRTVLLDVTQRKRAEEELLQLQHELQDRVTQRTALLKLLGDVAAMANEAATVEEAIQFCLAQVCTFNGWNFGHAWLPANDDPDELIAGYAWYEDAPQRFDRLRERVEQTRIRRGEGLVGRVLASGKPEVTTEVSRQLSVDAAPLAEHLGVHTVGAFPILVGNKAAGVLEFFSDKSIEPGERLLSLMCDVGTLLGRVVERRQAMRQLQESEQRFRVLFDDSPLPLWEEDWSHVKRFLHELDCGDTEAYRKFFDKQPDAVPHCMSLVKLTATNKASLRLFEAHDERELLANLLHLIAGDSYGAIADLLVRLATGHSEHAGEESIVTLPGDRKRVLFYFQAIPGYEDSLEKVVVSLIDISDRKELERQVIEAAADEQRRIGQDIHDGVGQELTGLRYVAQTHAESLARQSSPDAPTAERMTKWLTTVQQQLRAIIRQLVPVEVDKQGLVAALRGLAQQTSERHDLVCEFQCQRPVTVADAALATHLYRIVQEAVANSVRHAQATHIRIDLTEDEDALRLQVTDDGIGIRSTPEKSTGIGLRSMAYRAGLIGATLTIRAGEQGGTQVSCTVLRGGGLRWMADA